MRSPSVLLFIAALTTLTAICLLASIAPPFEPVTELVPVIAVLALLLSLAWIVRRQTFPLWAAIAGASVTATLLVSFGAVGIRGASTGLGQVGNPDIRILSLNLWFENRDLTPTLALIEAEAPDVIVLTEAGEAALMQLAAALPGYPSRFTCEAMPYCGVAIFSRLPGRAIGGGADLAAGLSRPPGNWGAIPLAAAEFRIPGSEDGWFPVIGVHVLRRGGMSADVSSISAVLDAVSGLEDVGGAILAGDFNATDWSWAMRRMDKRLSLKRRTFGIRTWPAPASPLRRYSPAPIFGIDHVFAGPAWSTTDVRRGPDVGSDHYPVLSAFRRVSERRPPAGE